MQQRMKWIINIYKLEFIGLFDGCYGAYSALGSTSWGKRSAVGGSE